MDQEKLRATWAEFCFHLSDNISPKINENVFEQKVLSMLEKLGWNEFRGEIKVKPSLQIGRQNFIIPDIVLYVSDNKAAIVLEIKRPAEDLSRPPTFRQLRSYMRQTKAEFGLLLGNEIIVYYDGALKKCADPLLWFKIRFKSDSTEGTDFVDFFSRNNFIAGKYEPDLKAHIARLERQQKINAVKKRLLSEETSNRLLEPLKDDFSDIETSVLMEAMKGLTITMSYGEPDESIKPISPAKIVFNKPQESILVTKNKQSGKYFIYLEDLKNLNARLINPDGRELDLSADRFEEPKYERVEYLLSYKLITKVQFEKYNVVCHRPTPVKRKASIHIPSQRPSGSPSKTSSRAKIKVTFPDGIKICLPKVAETMVEAIRKIGFDKVKSLNILMYGSPIVSNQKYNQDKYNWSDAGSGVFVFTHSNTDKKLSQLNEINDGLGLGLKIEKVSMA
jgi:hypothetical protein